MPARSPEERALIARIANATQKAKYPDQAQLTASARRGRRAQFEAQALELNPDATPEQVAHAADELQRAHMLRMSLRSAQARRKIRENTEIAETAETELAALGGA